MRFSGLGSTAWLAAVVFAGWVACSFGDVIKTKDGEEIIGRVLSFEVNHRSFASSRFVVKVGGEEQSLPIHALESIAFDPPVDPDNEALPQSGAPAIAANAAPSANRGATESETTRHWLTSSSRKRHNSKCRYYKSGKGRPCGPTEGVACKICGG
jgi:hypothetical protein